MKTAVPRRRSGGKKFFGDPIVRLLAHTVVLVFSPYLGTAQTGFLLTPVSGADGVFEHIVIEGDTVYRSSGTEGSYSSYMYFQCSETISDSTVYLEVTYKDTGFGYIEVEYNSVVADYDLAEVRYENYVRNLGGIRTAVYELTDADFRNAQNLDTDLRLTCQPSLQMHILSAKIHLTPTDLFLQFHTVDWLEPYKGPPYGGDDLVDATTIAGKVICGYQGWFRAAGDPDGVGWVHYVRGNSFDDVTVDMWPDMTEYSQNEQYPVPGWTLTSGAPATLFSSANKRTVLRHFQ